VANASANVPFTWTVSETTVSLTNPGSQSNHDGATVSLPLTSSDSLGNALSFTATNLPSGLTINSSTGTISGVIASNADTSSPYSVTVTATDSVANASANVPFTWTVGINHAPMGANNTVTTRENAAYTFATGDFGFTDPNDSPPDSLAAVEISTLPSVGSLTDNGTSVTAGEFVSASDISTGKLVFTPVAYVTGTAYANFTFQVQDNGGTADDGIDTDSTARTMTVNVSWVNQAPVGTTNTVTTLENTGYTFATADFGFTDPHDSPPDSLYAVKITTLPSVGSLKDNGTAVTIGQFVSASDIAAGGLVFTPATYASGTAYTSFTFQVQDNGGTASSGVDTDTTARSMTINVTWVNQAPVGTNNTVTTPETTAYVFATTDFGFTDPHDSPPDHLSAVEITTLPTVGILTDNGTAVTAGTFVSVSDITAGDLVYTPNLTTVALSNPGLQANFDGDVVSGMALTATDSASNSLTYTASNLPLGLSINSSTGVISGTIADTADLASPFLVTIFASDATANVANTRQFTWIVSPVSVALTNPGSLTNIDGDAVSLPLPATDSAGHSLTFSATGLPSGLSINSGTGQISGTIASGADVSSPYLVTVTATDSGVGVVAVQPFVWNVQSGATGAGVVTLANPGLHENHDGNSVSLSLTASDSDSNALTFSATGLPSGLSINSSSGVISGFISSGADSSSPYLVTVTAADSVADASAAQAFVWVVTPVASTPTVVTLTNPGMQVNLNGDSVDFSLTAADSASNALTFTESGLPSGLTINSSTGSITGTASASASSPYVVTVMATDSTASIYAIQKFVWLVGPDFTFQVRDDGGTANGGVDTDATARSMTINVTLVNHAPVGTNHTVTMLENTGYTFATADFGFTDPSDCPPDSLATVKITTLPSVGSLKDNGTAVTVGQFVSASDISSGKLVFTPATNASGTAYTSFTFQVQDNGGTASGGVDTDTTARSMTINVTGINQAPVGTDNTVTTLANSAYTFAEADFGFTDPNDSPPDHLSAVEITTLPSVGILTDNGTAVAAGTFVSVSDITAGDLVYTTNLTTVALSNPGLQASFDGDVVSGMALAATDSASNSLTYTASNLPSGLSINSSTGVISGTIADTADLASPFLVTIFASDATANVADMQQLTWIVSPVKVALTNPSSLTNIDGDAVSLSLPATDSAGHSLVYSATGLPSGLSINSSTGQISGTIASGADVSSPYLVTVTATDGELSVASVQPFVWNVQSGTTGAGVVTLANPGLHENHDGDAVSLSVTASDSDSNALTFSATGLPSGLSIDSSSGVISGSISSGAGSSSPYLVTVTATDSVAVASAAQAFVWVVAPAASTPTVVTLTIPGMQVNLNGASVDLSPTAADSASNALTFTESGLPSGLSINSSTGAITGTIAAGASASSPYVVTVTATDSTASVYATQKLVWLVRGPDNFTFQVQDDGGTANGGVDTDPHPKTMKVVFGGPVAVDDTGFLTNENSPLTIASSSILANDSNAIGNVQTISDFSQGANGGTVAFNGSTFTYTPSTGFSGEDQFTYTINDGIGGTSTATVFVVVKPLLVANDDGAYPSLNTPTMIDVLQNDSDGGISTLKIESTSTPSDGIVQIALDGSTVTYTPNTGFIGKDSFTYSIADGHGQTATATVHLTVGDGQWATSVLGASSSWTDSGPYDWYPEQALGTPNTLTYGDNPTAWAPENNNDGTEWLSLGFATPEQATGVLIHETDGNGFVTEVDLLDTSNVWHTIWTGTDSSTQGAPADFLITFSATSYQVQGVKILVDTDLDPNDWPEIDAVRLLSSTAPSISKGTVTASTVSASVNEDTSTTDVDSSLNISIPGLISGPSNDPLLVTITGDPANGTVIINDNSTPNDVSDDYFTYSPDPLFNGSDSFTYQVTDIYGVTATGTVNITVNPVNHAPDAEDANAVTDKNSAVVVDVLSNDSDPDGDTLTVSSVTNGTNGTVAITDSGTDVTYTPATDYVGLDQFTYTISDGRGGTATATVYVNVYETGAWASSVVSFSSQYDPGDGSGDWAATQALGAPDTFAYGDSATAWAPSDLNTGAETLVVGFTTPAPATGVIVRESNGNGFVTKIEVESTSNTWHTMWTGTDPASQASVTDLIVSFPATSYDVQAVRITVNTTIDPNDYAEIDAVRLVTGGSPTSTTITTSAFYQAPVSSDAWRSANENTAVTIPVLANDSDPAGSPITVTSTTGGTDGTVTTDGTTVTYTPNTGYTGPDTFTYTITDGFGGTSTSTVHINVSDGQWASSITGFSSQADDGTYGTSVLALGPGDTWNYGDTSNSWSPNSSSTATSETLALGIASADYAAGVIVRESSGNGFVTEIELQDTSNAWHTVWTGTDTAAAGNVENFVVTFSTTSYEVQAVRITVDPATGDGNPVGIDAVEVLTASAPPSLPTAPSAAADSATTAEDMPININVLANDTNTADSQLVIRIISAPANGSAVIDLHGSPNDSSDDFINYTPNDNYSGSDSFTYSITDPFGQTSSATVTITVSAVNQPPVAGGTLAYTTATTAVTLNLLTNASDPDTGDTLSVASYTQGQNGSVSVSSGVATYTPNYGFTGEDEFTYTISDGNSHTSIGTAQVIVYPSGQWASSVIAASSGLASDASATGIPDDAAWTPDNATAMEFLTVGFTTAQYATGVLIREESGAGSIMQVQLLDTSGVYHTIWTGTDPTSTDGGPADFTLNFPVSYSYQVSGVKILLSTGNSPSIDAVELTSGGSYSSVTLSAQGFDSNGNFVETAYNSSSQPTTVITYTQGAFAQIVTSTYTSGYVSATVTIDALGNETQDTFDASGNKLTETDGYGTSGASTTTYTYDSQNRMLSLTDPEGNETTWTYTVNTTVMTDPLLNTDTKTYNAKNELVSELNRNDELTTYAYYDDGSLETETEYAGATTSTTVVDTLSWTYNADGTVATAGNDNGTYTFTYDDQGRVIGVEEPFGVTLTFGYDQYGNRNLVKDNLGGEEDSLYNASGQLLSRTLTQSGSTLRIDFTYDEFGRVSTEKRYSDAAGTTLVATTTFTYDLSGNVTSIISKDSSGATLDEFDYTYNVGQLASEIDNQPTIDGSPVTINYSYDPQGQLTAAGSNSYSYDINGNRNMSGYTYNTSYTNEITSDGTWDYTYDANGNITGKVNIASGVSWTYGYDNRNELVQAKEFDASSTLVLEADYKYDIYGNRIEQAVTQSSVTTVQRYAIDGWNPAKSNPVGNEDYDVWADLDGSNNLETQYLRGDSVDQILGRVDVSGGSGTGNWSLTDSQGSVRDVIDNTGAVKDSISYDAFGNITTEYDATYRGRYAWTGRELDIETALQYNRERYYDSTTGRWISQDPLGFDAGDSNLYRYVNNAPTSASDPSGLVDWYYHTAGPNSGAPTNSLPQGVRVFGNRSATVGKWAFNPLSPVLSQIPYYFHDRTGMVLSYRGPAQAAEKVRWIQGFTVTTSIVYADKGENKIKLLPSQTLPAFKVKSGVYPEIKTSDAVNHTVYLDSVGREVDYYRPGAEPNTGIGGVSASESWIFDSPNGPEGQFTAANQVRAGLAALEASKVNVVVPPKWRRPHRCSVSRC
jgi:RHS repeat-associated protein